MSRNTTYYPVDCESKTNINLLEDDIIVEEVINLTNCPIVHVEHLGVSGIRNLRTNDLLNIISFQHENFSNLASNEYYSFVAHSDQDNIIVAYREARANIRRKIRVFFGESIESIEFCELLFGNLLKLQEYGKIDTALDYLFDSVEEQLVKGNFKLCNKLFKDPRIDELDINLKIGFLTITFPWKDELNLRYPFYCKVDQELGIKYKDEPQNVNLIIGGLG